MASLLLSQVGRWLVEGGINNVVTPEVGWVFTNTWCNNKDRQHLTGPSLDTVSIAV